MTGLSTRDALAKALREIPVVWETETHRAVKFMLDRDDAEFVADHLIASGAVVDAATLADDEALVDRVVRAQVDASGAISVPPSGLDRRVAVAALRALAAALSERESS